MTPSVDEILNEFQSLPNTHPNCWTCRCIAENPTVGEFITKGLGRNLTLRQVITIVKKHCGVDLSPDSLRNHGRNNHGG